LLNDGADNPRALANGCRRTLGNDEHVAELHKVRDLPIDRGEVPVNCLPHAFTRARTGMLHVDNAPDFTKGEAKRFGLANKSQL